MSAAREKDQSDFDLERFVNMFDEAMTSSDPRVMETLRSLMMIVTLTRPESTELSNMRKGPLRRAFEDMNHLWKRLEQMEEELRQMHQRMSRENRDLGPWPRELDHDKYTMAAAAKMAQQIDSSVMHQVSMKINNGGNAGLNLAQPKGLIKK